MAFWTKKATSLRVPTVGELVWWAPKYLECRVTEVHPTCFRFEGGPLITRDGKRPRVQWTVVANFDAATWDESLKTWLVGQGETPKVLRGVVVKPEPAVIIGGIT